MRRMHVVFLGVLLSTAGSSAWPQGAPLGPEFRVNSFTANHQSGPSVAADASGNFVVVWSGGGADFSGGILAQRYASSGALLGGEFQVNTYTPWAQLHPDVASDVLGNFVVVWQSWSQDGFGYGIFGQRYDSAGAPVGAEFRVNTFTTGWQVRPSVAMDADGDFVVAWDSGGQDGSGYAVFGQRYQSSGVPAGPEFRVNAYTSSDQTRVDVDSEPRGSFVVVWQSQGEDGSGPGVFGQRYDSAGIPLGSEFRVNTYTINSQRYPTVAVDGTGGFIVAWQSFQDFATSVYARRYSASGMAWGTEFRVNTYWTVFGNQSWAAVGSDADGNFVVLWTSFDQDGSVTGVFGQRYRNTGGPTGVFPSKSGPEFRVNTYTTDYQGNAAVAVDDTGRFIVVWDSYGQDGSQGGIFGQRYGEIVPVDVTQFVIE